MKNKRFYLLAMQFLISATLETREDALKSYKEFTKKVKKLFPIFREISPHISTDLLLVRC